MFEVNPKLNKFDLLKYWFQKSAFGFVVNMITCFIKIYIHKSSCFKVDNLMFINGSIEQIRFDPFSIEIYLNLAFILMGIK